MKQVKTISITIPLDLHAEMQEWKHIFNYSQLCTEAISKAIRQKKEYADEMRTKTRRMLDKCLELPQ